MAKDKRVPGIQELDKKPLFCNQMTASHTPAQFFLDFRLVYPQFAPDNTQTTVVSHSTIVFEPYHLKEVVEVLQENIKRYEDDFGKIEVPKAIENAKKKATPTTPVVTTAPDYLG